MTAVASIGYTPHVLPARTVLHRVQRTTPAPSTFAVGPVLLPPMGLLAGRFDLAGHPTAAFATSDLTAIYETQARRDTQSVSMTALARRKLLSVQTLRDLRLADLRPHTAPWPLLIANRYGPTQALADDAFGKGFEGVIHLSAQQHLGECVALFGDAIAAVQRLAQAPLNQAGRLHTLVAQALIGTMLPLVP